VWIHHKSAQGYLRDQDHDLINEIPRRSVYSSQDPWKLRRVPKFPAIGAEFQHGSEENERNPGGSRSGEVDGVSGKMRRRERGRVWPAEKWKRACEWSVRDASHEVGFSLVSSVRRRACLRIWHERSARAKDLACTCKFFFLKKRLCHSFGFID
jgi:hypothetical protein